MDFGRSISSLNHPQSLKYSVHFSLLLSLAIGFMLIGCTTGQGVMQSHLPDPISRPAESRRKWEAV